MDFTFLGVRGSTPASGSRFDGYGGHTSCYLVQGSGKAPIVVDTGTGIIAWGKRLMKESAGRALRLNVVYTHFHLDHLMGLLFFTPLFSPRTQITFYSALPPKSLETTLGNLMGQRFFPVKFRETPAKKDFKQIPAGAFSVSGVRISHAPLIHPQGALAFRFSHEGKSVVLATDTEHPDEGIDSRLAEFASGADCLIYDAMFTPSEYIKGRQGWGHSTWKEGVKIASEAEVGKLYLSHFNPAHTDAAVGRLRAAAGKVFTNTFAAKEGQTIPF